MKIFDWIFTWIAPPFLFACLIIGFLKAKRKYQPGMLSDGGYGPELSYLPTSLKRQTTTVDDRPKKRSFYPKLQDALNKASKARKLILHSDLPEKDRLQIADEILYLIDDIVELQTIKLKEEQELWK